MPRLLLLDLDGVVVARDPRRARGESTLLLHPDLPAAARRAGFDVEILTHRSRGEAKQIVAALPMASGPALPILAARDLVVAALTAGELPRLLSHGILKVFALAHLERKYGLPRREMAILDDSPGNIRTAAEAGIGLAIQAPAPVFEAAGIRTFRSEAAIAALSQWAAGAGDFSTAARLARDVHLPYGGLIATPIRADKLAGLARRLARGGRRFRQGRRDR